MSRFLFPPLIQQLRVANAGVIAFVDSGVHAVAVLAQAFAAQFVGQSKSFDMSESLGGAATLADGGTHAIAVGAVFTEIFSEASESLSFDMTNALEAVTATPAESMQPSVVTFTSVS